ncbi:hypothetical protein RB200_24305 [Streptomyces sp. PmtG]
MTTTSKAPPRAVPWRRRPLILSATLMCAGAVGLTFAYPGGSLVTRLYEGGQNARARVVAVTVDGGGRTSGVTVGFHDRHAEPVTAELATAPPLPEVSEGDSLKVWYDVKKPSDVLSGPQMRRLAPEWNAVGDRRHRAGRRRGARRGVDAAADTGQGRGMRDGHIPCEEPPVRGHALNGGARPDRARHGQTSPHARVLGISPRPPASGSRPGPGT